MSAKNLMVFILVCVSIYLILAVIHHWKTKTLNLEVVVEYILIAALALVIFQSFIT